jgi:integrase
MSIRRRNGRLYVDFYTPSGRRVREVVATDDRREAQEYHDKLKAEYWKAERLGHKPRVPFAAAAARWLREAQKASIRNDALHIAFWRGHFTYMDEITREKADLAVAHLGDSNANRYTATLRSILHKAADEWGMMEKAPKMRMREEPDRRIRFLTHEEAGRLVSSIAPRHRPLIRLLFATGLRLGSALGLTWQQIDLQRRVAWIYADQSKNRQSIAVPLNDDAMQALQEARGRHRVSVFDQARPTHAVWKKALERAELTDFRIHDCRHTWASWHVQAGTPLYALQEMGGWKTVDMVRKYAHLAAEHLAEHAAKIGSVGTGKAQPSDSGGASDSTAEAKSLIAGGEGGIRTHVSLSGPSDFESLIGRAAPSQYIQ